MVYCVGLTGRAASGKSTAALYFTQQGITVLCADTYAKALVEPGSVALLEIQQHFGPDILTATGTLNRRALRTRILQDATAKRWLEDCLHPRIREAIERAITTVKTPYCVIEIPLLSDRKTYPYLNRVLLIEASHEKQVERLMARDHITQEEAEALLSAQSSQDAYRTLADDIILNDGITARFEEKLAQFHQNMLNRQRGK